MDDEQIQFIGTILARYLSPSRHKAFIIGSRSRGDATPFSDFDIAIEGPRLEPEVYFNIVGDLEDSDFPYLVDVVQLCDVSQAFRESAERSAIPIHLKKEDYGRDKANPRES